VQCADGAPGSVPARYRLFCAIAPMRD
jgi:hypothetical protein